jgi:hypothetical protein
VIPFPIGEFGFVQTRNPAHKQRANHDGQHITASLQLVVLLAGGWPGVCGVKNKKIGAALGRPDVRFVLVAFVWRSN